MNFFNGFNGGCCDKGFEHEHGRDCGCSKGGSFDCCELIMLLILLSCFCGGGHKGCGFGGDNCLWIILLLCCCGGGHKGCC